MDRFTSVMAVITVVLAFGSHLVVDNRRTGIPLPWEVLQHLPFVDDIITVRLALYTWLLWPYWLGWAWIPSTIVRGAGRVGTEVL